MIENAYPGPIIEANSFEEADAWCKKNTQYLFVEQEILEVDQKDYGEFNQN